MGAWTIPRPVWAPEVILSAVFWFFFLGLGEFFLTCAYQYSAIGLRVLCRSLELPPSWAVPSTLAAYCTYFSHLDLCDSYFCLLNLRLLSFFRVLVPHSPCSVTRTLPPGRSWAIIGLTSFVSLLFRHCSLELPVSQCLKIFGSYIWFCKLFEVGT